MTIATGNETYLSNNFVIATGIKLPIKTEMLNTASGFDPEILYIKYPGYKKPRLMFHNWW